MRGNTAPLFYWDEFAFLKFNKIIYGSASPAQSKAMQVASKNGKPYGKVFTTTPNNYDSAEGKFCKDMMDSAAPFVEEMYDWDEPRVREYIEANSDNDFVHIQFSYKELGHDEKWFKKQCRDLNNDLFLIKREILLEWPIASDKSPFSEEQLEDIKSSVRDPIGRIFLRNVYRLNFYDDIDRDTSWLIGVDVSGGLKRDNSAIVIAHPETLEIVADFKNNSIDTTELFVLLVELVTQYLPNSVLIIERNSYGLTVINNALRSPIARNLYWEERAPDGQRKVKSMLAKATSTGRTEYYGVNTDKTSRDRMVNELLKMVVADQPHVVRSKNVYDEIKTLEYKKTGKIEHADGKHDDCVMAYLFIRYVMAYGTNLSKFMIGSSSSGASVKDVRASIRKNMALMGRLNTDLDSGSLSDYFIAQESQKKMRESSKASSRFMDILNLNK